MIRKADRRLVAELTTTERVGDRSIESWPRHFGTLSPNTWRGSASPPLRAQAMPRRADPRAGSDASPRDIADSNWASLGDSSDATAGTAELDIRHTCSTLPSRTQSA